MLPRSRIYSRAFLFAEYAHAQHFPATSAPCQRFASSSVIFLKRTALIFQCENKKSCFRQVLHVLRTAIKAVSTAGVNLRKQPDSTSNIIMDDLPPELQQIICSLLTPPELKPLRLASRQFAAAAIPHLIPRLFLFNHPDSCQVVQRIVNHSEFKKHVNTLVLDPRIVPYFEDFHAWADSLPSDWNVPEWSEWARNHGRGEWGIDVPWSWSHSIRRARMEYTKAFDEAEYSEDELINLWMIHKSVMNDPLSHNVWYPMVDTILTAFSHCPNLKNVVVTDHHYPWSSGAEKRARTFQDLPLALGPSHLSSDHTVLMGLDDIIASRLETFTIRGVKLASWLVMKVENFQNLKHLRIGVRDCEGDFNNILEPVLNAILNPQTLKIDFPLRHHGGNQSFSNLFNSTHWNQLLECHLTCICATEDELVNFFLRHVETMRAFSLSEMEIEGGTWPSFFCRLTGRFSALEEVEFLGLRSVHDFITDYTFSYLRAAQRFILEGGSLPKEERSEHRPESERSEDMEDCGRSMQPKLYPGLWEDYDSQINPFL